MNFCNSLLNVKNYRIRFYHLSEIYNNKGRTLCPLCSEEAAA